MYCGDARGAELAREGSNPSALTHLTRRHTVEYPDPADEYMRALEFCESLLLKEHAQSHSDGVMRVLLQVRKELRREKDQCQS